MLPESAPLSARRLRRLLGPMIRAAVAASGADRYRKSFPAFAHVWMLLLHAMSGNASLRQSHAQQAADGRLARRLGMAGWVSYSQLARSSASRPAGLFEGLFAALAREARGRPAADPALGALRAAAALDSSFFSLSEKLSPWGKHKGHAPGVRLQAGLDLARSIPDTLRVTLPDVNDRRALAEWDLSALSGWTVVFDLGYYAHAHFRRLLGAGVSFVTRLQAQARYDVTGSLPAPGGRTPEGDAILSDERITLGSPNNRTGAVLPGMRLVTYRTAGKRTHRLITDRWDLTAPEVVALYRKRWQIELFFRWLKRQLGALRPLGHSREAVWLTILVAAIAAVLAHLADASRPAGMTRVSWLRALHAAIAPQLQPSG